MAQTGKKAAGSGSRSNQKSGKKTSSGTRSSNKKNSAAKSSSKKRAGGKAAAAAERRGGLQLELAMILTAVAGIMLFAANLEMLGAVGVELRRWQFGVAGTMAYLFPIWIAGQIIYVLQGSGEDRFWEMKRLLASAVLFVALCGLMAIFGGRTGESGVTVQQYFAEGTSGINGGVLGGVIGTGLQNSIGDFGGYLILAAAMLTALIFLTDFRPIEDGGAMVEEQLRTRKEQAPVRQQRKQVQLERKQQKKREKDRKHQLKKAEKAELERQRLERDRLELEQERLVWERQNPEWDRQDTQRQRDRREVDERVRARYRGTPDALPEEGEEDLDESLRMAHRNPSLIFVDDLKGETAGSSTAGDGNGINGAAGAERKRSNRNTSGKSANNKNRKRSITAEEIAASEGFDRRDPEELKAHRLSREELEQLQQVMPEDEERYSRLEITGITSQRRRPDNNGREVIRLSAPEAGASPEDREEAGAQLWQFPEHREEPQDPGAGDISGSREEPERQRIPVTPEYPEEEDFPEIPEAAEESEQSGASDYPEAYDDPEIPGDPATEELREPSPREALSSEDSMSAYDEFRPGDPNAVLRGEAGFPAGGNASGRNRAGQTGGGSAWASGSVWESSDNSGSNAGRSFSRRSSGGSEGPKSGKPAAAEALYPEIAQALPEQTPVKKEYELPTTALLKDAEHKGGTSEEALRRTAQKLETTLNNFGVKATMKKISCGPSVTRYELEPAQGVKVRRIVDLTDDLKLNLEATDIRIEAPIPGKAAVGIEVPNEVKQMVSLKEMLEADTFRRAASKVTFAVGKDIGGEVVTADLAKMPHLLIAGATGSGKSVCINSLIASILYKAKPDEVQLVMIDPKVVELSVYNGIPHLHFPVVTDPKKAAGALNWAVTEMTERYKKFAETGTRDIRGYNRHMEELNGKDCVRMPQIVIIVDELADLMMVAAGEVEEAICRLAQLARAAGIHLVLATQRPSVNVITGLIKANVPSRIAFAVSSGVDSRTIIDMNGAEKLLGNGDMLFYPSGYPKPVRIQGAFVSDGEVQELVKFWADQNTEEPRTEKDLDQAIESSTGAGRSQAELDDLFENAGFFIIDKEKASIGNLQRAFRIGFNRAARIMDQLCDYGVVGPEEGTKARQILMTREQFEELLAGMR